MNKKKPIFVIVIAILSIISAIIPLFLSVGLIFGGLMATIVSREYYALMPVIIGFGIFLISALWIVIGIGLINLKSFARKYVIIASIITLPFVIFLSIKKPVFSPYIFVCLLYLLYFNHPRVKEKFE